MQFTQIPNQFAPLGAEAIYTAETPAAATIDIRIADAADGTLLGAKRFAGVTAAAFDAAPCMRRAVCFVPSVGGTGFHDPGKRLVTAVVRAEIQTDEAAEATNEGSNRLKAVTGTAGQSGNTATSPERSFLPCCEIAAAPALLTTMPRQRLIAPGECDELTLLTAASLTVSITADTGDSLMAESYSVKAAGLHLFRVDTRDFPGVRTLTVDAGACGTVVYTLVAPPQGSKRLAWRTSAGSIEHYTFPVVRTERVVVSKKWAYGPAGHETAATAQERRTVLASAYETRPVAESLAGLLASPDVWLAEGDVYTPVDILSEEAVVHRHGAMSGVEVEFRSKRKNRLPWN